MAEMGRPKADNPLSKTAHVRMAPEHEALIEQAAKLSKRKIGQYMREASIAQAKRDIAAERRRHRATPDD